MNHYSRIKAMRASAIGLLLLGSTCLLAADHLSDWALFFGPTCLVGGLHLLRRGKEATDEVLFDLAIRSAGLVREGERFTSMKPILVAHRAKRGGPSTHECLGRDRAGHWMTYRFEIRAGRPANVQVDSVSEEAARRWLQNSPALYAKWFAEAVRRPS